MPVASAGTAPAVAELSVEKARPLRADAQRNREKLLAAATQAFAEHGEDVALETVAARAGVGIGTLYRHFPNRDALVIAAYRHEVAQLCAAGPGAAGGAAPGRGAAGVGRALHRLHRGQARHGQRPALGRGLGLASSPRRGRSSWGRCACCSTPARGRARCAPTWIPGTCCG